MSGFDLSKKVAIHMRKNLNLNEEEEELAAYSFEMIFHSFITFVAICLTTWLLGCLQTTLIAIFVASLLRILSGGAHSVSPVNCTLLTVLVAAFMGKISLIYSNQIPALVNIILVSIVLLFSMRIIWVLAPVDSPAKPITSKNHQRQLRNLSVATVFSISALQLILMKLNYSYFSQYTLAASLGIIWQTFTLTPAGHKFFSTIDSIINNFKRR